MAKQLDSCERARSHLTQVNSQEYKVIYAGVKLRSMPLIR